MKPFRRRVTFDDVDFAHVPFFGRYFFWLSEAESEALNLDPAPRYLAGHAAFKATVWGDLVAAPGRGRRPAQVAGPRTAFVDACPRRGRGRGGRRRGRCRPMAPAGRPAAEVNARKAHN